MNNTTPRKEKRFARIAVTSVLLHGIFDCLFRQAILKFEGGDG